jgi:hypothetical protein
MWENLVTALFLFAFLWHESAFLLVFGVPVEVIRVSPVLNARAPEREFLISFKRSDHFGPASIYKL